MKISDKLLKEEMDIIPRGWGLAYWLADVRVGVYLPIPLNVIVRVLRELWFLFIRGVFPSYIGNKCMKAWMAGCTEAMNFHFAQGYRLGEKAGDKAARDAIAKAFDEFLEEDKQKRADITRSREAELRK